MSDPASPGLPGLPGAPGTGDGSKLRREKWLVSGLVALAVVRVALLCLAVPLFTNLDEESHLDTVHKYARGYWPGEPRETFDVRVADWAAMYGSPEFTAPQGMAATGQSPAPMWMLPPDARERFLASERERWLKSNSYESHSPPAYYALAAAWMHAGELVGLADAKLVYWTRVLNALLLGGLVWLAWRTLSRWEMPPAVRIGVPVLLACAPQDVYYSINSDGLSPLVSLSALAALVEWARPSPRSAARDARFSIAAGLLAALAVLTKLSNYPVLLALLLVAVVRLRRRPVEPMMRGGGVVAVSLLFIAAAMPIAAWCIRNQIHLHDATGTAAKTTNSDWTRLPVARWFEHPIFGPRGVAYFIAECLRTLWRGELVWYSRRVGAGPMDAVYVFASLALLVIATIRLARERVTAFFNKMPLLLCLACVVTAPLLLVWTSIAWDFGSCVYPSKALPYLTSGRLILGSFVPLLVLMMWGLERACPTRLRPTLPLAIVAVFSLVMLLAGVLALTPMFGSAFNWFHIPS